MRLGPARHTTWHWCEVLVTEVAVVASVGIVALRTRFGAGPSTGTWGSVLVLVVLAAPAVALVPLTRAPVLRHVACVLALLAWVPLAWSGGDLSCVDCAMALLLPASLLPLQLGVYLASAVRYGSRRDPPGDPRPPVRRGTRAEDGEQR